MKIKEQRLQLYSNKLETALLLSAMVSMLAASAWFIGGTYVAAAAVSMILLALLIVPRLSSHAIMRMQRARRMDSFYEPEIHHLVSRLAQKAGLKTSPMIYWLRDASINAVAIGNNNDPAIGISDGALRNLSANEMAGVLAHEIAHLAAGDTRTMVLSEIIQRMTGFVTTLGLVLIAFIELTVPQIDFPIWMPLFFFAAPLCLVLMQLALSRSREYAADLGAVRLTGNPSAFISALRKIDQLARGRWARLMRQPVGILLPSWMQTHPPLNKRVAKITERYSFETAPQDLARRRWRRTAFPLWETHFPARVNFARRCTPRWTY